MTRSRSTDLLVVGAGPVGLAVAIRARLGGATVRVIDARRPPIDKACGEGLMPDGVARLEQLGVRLPHGEAMPFRGIRYLDGDSIVEGRFPGRPGFGIRRTRLHEALTRRAGQLGVELCWATRAEGLERDGVVTATGTLRADWIVAADGLRSPLRRQAGLDGRPAKERRFGLRRHHAIRPWTDLVEVYWSDEGEAYVTPVGPEEVGVAFLGRAGRRGLEDLEARFPSLARRLAGSPIISRERGAGPLAQRVSAVTTGRLALVGDAAGYLDAITGEGLALGFHHAFALVEAIEHGDLRRYARDHRRIARRPETMTRLLLAIERRPWLRRRAMRALVRWPDLFRRLLAVHVREAPVLSLASPRALTARGR